MSRRQRLICIRDRAKYTALEKKDIGRINHAIRKIDIQIKALTANKTTKEVQADAALTAQIDAKEKEKEKWNAEYEILAKQAEEMREAQEKDSLTYRLVTGEEKTLPLGDFVHIYQPNQFGFGDKVGFFVSQFWGFLSENPREANMEGGIFPAIFGTFVMTALMSIASMPFGVRAALNQRDYAKD